jgi:xanthosine utilization system XapX-like protein
MAEMRVYLGAGLLVGIVYSLLNVPSSAPPMVALVSAQQALTTGRED